MSVLTGADIRRRRKLLGLSQTALSAILGVRQATISDWETGKLTIDHPSILDLALRALEHEKRTETVQ